MVIPVNPVNQMGDIIVKEGYQQPLKTDQDKQKAFNEYLVEEVFLKNMFDTDNSIFKPEEEDSLFPGANSLYGDLTKKQIARYLAENDVNLLAGQKLDQIKK